MSTPPSGARPRRVNSAPTRGPASSRSCPHRCSCACGSRRSTSACISPLFHSRAPVAMPTTSPPGRTRKVHGSAVTRQRSDVSHVGIEENRERELEIPHVGLQERLAAPRDPPRRRARRARGRGTAATAPRATASRGCRAGTRWPRSSGRRACPRWSAIDTRPPSSVLSVRPGPCWPTFSSTTPAFSKGSSAAVAALWWPPSSPGRRTGRIQRTAPRTTTARTPRTSDCAPRRPEDPARRPAFHASPGFRAAPVTRPRRRSSPSP